MVVMIDGAHSEKVIPSLVKLSTIVMAPHVMVTNGENASHSIGHVHDIPSAERMTCEFTT